MLTVLAAALGVGLLQGFLHCTGMCGPFVLAFSVRLQTGTGTGIRHAILLTLWHNGGRILSFTVLGAVFGGVGSFVNAAGHTTGLDALADLAGGGLMVLWALDELRTGHGGALVERWSLMRVTFVQSAVRRLSRERSPMAAFLAGIILGLHPCGLLFAMLLTAASSGSAATGALALLVFGLGTLPALFSVAAAGWYGRKRLEGRWASYATAVLIGLSGLLFALRGMAANGWLPGVNPWLF